MRCSRTQCSSSECSGCGVVSVIDIEANKVQSQPDHHGLAATLVDRKLDDQGRRIAHIPCILRVLQSDALYKGAGRAASIFFFFSRPSLDHHLGHANAHNAFVEPFFSVSAKAACFLIFWRLAFAALA